MEHNHVGLKLFTAVSAVLVLTPMSGDMLSPTAAHSALSCTAGFTVDLAGWQ